MHRMLKVNRRRVIVITCGSDPVTASSYNDFQKSLDFILHSTVYPVADSEIVDTNGCGDSFAGGFLSQYVTGQSLEKCLRAVYTLI